MDTVAREVTLSKMFFGSVVKRGSTITLLHSKWPKLNEVLAILSTTGVKQKAFAPIPLKEYPFFEGAG